MTCPTLIVHGAADSLVPATMAQTLFDRCASANKELYLAQDMVTGACSLARPPSCLHRMRVTRAGAQLRR